MWIVNLTLTFEDTNKQAMEIYSDKIEKLFILGSNKTSPYIVVLVISGVDFSHIELVQESIWVGELESSQRYSNFSYCMPIVL